MENQLQNGNRVWEDLLSELFRLNYEQQSRITAVEQKIYAALNKAHQQLEGLITLMFAHIMLGNSSKAKSMAHKIWEIGGSLAPFFEQVYIQNLLNLGLIDMVKILLSPRIEQLKDNIVFFYPSLVKYAVMTGDIPLLEQLGAFADVTAGDEVLYDFADLYESGNRREHFKNIQKLILEHSREYLSSYEYELYDDRGFPELQIVLYVNYDNQFCSKMQQNITAKINAFWRSCGQEPLNNLSVIVENIRLHPSWDDSVESDELILPSGDSADNWGL